MEISKHALLAYIDLARIRNVAEIPYLVLDLCYFIQKMSRGWRYLVGLCSVELEGESPFVCLYYVVVLCFWKISKTCRYGLSCFDGCSCGRGSDVANKQLSAFSPMPS